MSVVVNRSNGATSDSIQRCLLSSSSHLTCKAIFGMFLRVLVIYFCLGISWCDEGFCPVDDGKESCGSGSPFGPRYLLYDVNPPEGFNLRRDVYMRMAVFMHHFSKKNKDWHLVLPPWDHLYHWRSDDVGEQSQLPWSIFFDVESLSRFAPVIEMSQFLEEQKSGKIDQVFVLQRFKDAFTENWTWEDKWLIEDCNKDTRHLYKKMDNEVYSGWFWNYENLTAKDVKCVSYQGPASQIQQLLESTSHYRSVMIDRAEVALHDTFGDKKFWECRRSMRFNRVLVKEAERFRQTHLNSTDDLDHTVRPLMWEEENIKRKKKRGGPYVAVHLRRRDFLSGRSSEVPSLESAAKQISAKLNQLHLSTVFVATDAEPAELEELKELLKDYKVFNYAPDHTARTKFKDGGVAIIDQIICSHARYFIGSYESTFSFRIQEEREIMGFSLESTFNRLCGTSKKCTQPTKWKIVH